MESLANPWVVFGGMAVLLVLGAGLGILRERRRSQALRDVVSRLGLAFSEEDPGLAREGFGGLPLFGRGRSRSYGNVARGGDELVFGYAYSVGSGRNQTRHRQTVAAFHLSKGLGGSSPALPRFELRPERLFDRIRGLVGRRDVDFDDDPEFSRRNHLAGPDENALRALFARTLRQHFLAHPGWCVEGEGAWLIAYRHRKRVAPDDLVSFLEEARRIRSLFAGHRG